VIFELQAFLTRCAVRCAAVAVSRAVLDGCAAEGGSVEKKMAIARLPTTYAGRRRAWRRMRWPRGRMDLSAFAGKLLAVDGPDVQRGGVRAPA
jgi:hypothetical protein